MPPRPCSVCQHEERLEIDHLLILRRPQRAIGEAYGLSQTALSRHLNRCVQQELREAQQRQMAEAIDRGADSLLEEMGLIRNKTLSILQVALEDDDNRLALQAISEARKNVEMLAKLRGEIGDSDSQVVEVVLGFDAPPPNWTPDTP